MACNFEKKKNNLEKEKKKQVWLILPIKYKFNTPNTDNIKKSILIKISR